MPADNDNILKKIVRELISNGATPLGHGNSRATFSFGNCVFKVPTSRWGFYANLYEAALYEKVGERDLPYSWHAENYTVKLAKCSILKIYGVPVLKMEKLETVSREIRLQMFDPDFRESLDDLQGGFDKDGVYKIYDFEHLAHAWIKHLPNEEIVRKCAFDSHDIYDNLGKPDMWPFYLTWIGMNASYG